VIWATMGLLFLMSMAMFRRKIWQPWREGRRATASPRQSAAAATHLYNICRRPPTSASRWRSVFSASRATVARTCCLRFAVTHSKAGGHACPPAGWEETASSAACHVRPVNCPGLRYAGPLIRKCLCNLCSHTRTVVRECLKATKQVNGKGQNSTPRHTKTP